MRHVYHCPLRWSDMDMLGHVNNVTYVDYLQEARIDMLATHAPVSGGERLAEGVVVVRHEVEFLLPLVFRERPVRIESWVTDVRAATFTMCYEILDVAEGGARTTYARARTVLAPYVFSAERPRRVTPTERDVLGGFSEPGGSDVREPAPGGGTGADAPDVRGRHRYELKVRWSDVDAYGHVNNVTYFEYYQEARITMLDALRRHGDVTRGMVVGRVDVDYRRPILFRLAPYVVESWVSRVGTASFVLDSAITDGDVVLSRARVVMVGYDAEAGGSRALTETERTALADLTG